MNNFERAHNQWLEPPEDDPVCEECGESLVPDLNADWFCNNRFCPSQFGEGTVEHTMAEKVAELTDSNHRYMLRNEMLRREVEKLKEQIEELKWMIQENNK